MNQFLVIQKHFSEIHISSKTQIQSIFDFFKSRQKMHN